MNPAPAWLEEAALQQFLAAIRQAGGEARVVGGAVRDFLMGLQGGDIDLATTLLPQQVMDIAHAQGGKAIPTGIEHGTVTVVLHGRVVEVTTLRRDVTTDGRRATIAFTDDWREDASRRDFTMNALYMDAHGAVTDYFDGREDIAAQHVRFIGEPAARIAEDALRILRYFRFLASHGKPPADEEALQAIAQRRTMIDALSGERIANEMRKLLSTSNPSYALRLMAQHDVAPHVFGGAIDASRMVRLHLLESQAEYQVSVWARVLALLATPTAEAVQHIIGRWKLARHEARQLHELLALPAFDASAPRHAHTYILRRYGAPVYLDWLLLNATRTVGITIAPWVALAHAFTPPLFPLKAKDLMALGMKEGKALGEVLAQLERRWEEGDYTLTKEQLTEIASQLASVSPKE